MGSSEVALTRRLVGFGFLLTLGACAKGFQDPSSSNDRGPARDLAVLTYRAVDRLVRLTPQLTAEVPVVVSSVTDSQQVDQSSRFGTLIADLVKSRLAQGNFTVSEQRLRSAMLLRKDEGEMMLTRDSRAMVSSPPYSCVLTGTYAAAHSRVYVALKLISAGDARIMSAVDFVVWRNEDVSRLLSEIYPSAT
jgi:TolB-like protein